ncbi:LPD29 domain-containing protein [Xenorhabdus vietnamensis]|uniref:LPD29 domain-containing protein n=1 Tax=Xenorhabdus vietnamensis TaxID=351656 RepID=UPI000A324888|nr:LPD29 domain-containing protein [Xenorhabdus vietnamensis]
MLDKNGRCETKQVAKNIRAELKKFHPKTRFSVREEHYDSITINWIDGVNKDKIEELVSKF